MVGQAPRIALDAMGGDGGPATMIAGAAMARARGESVQFTLFGDESTICAEIAKHPILAGSEVVHCDDVITGDDKPSQAIRRTKTSSCESSVVTTLIATGSPPSATPSKTTPIRPRPMVLVMR